MAVVVMKQVKYGLPPRAVASRCEPEDGTLTLAPNGPGGGVKMSGAVHSHRAESIHAIVAEGIEDGLRPVPASIFRQFEHGAATGARTKIQARTARRCRSVQVAAGIHDQGRT